MMDPDGCVRPLTAKTIDAKRNQLKLMRFRRVLYEKRPEMIGRHGKVIFQYDNAWRHMTKVVKDFLQILEWEVLPTSHFLQILLQPATGFFHNQRMAK